MDEENRDVLALMGHLYLRLGQAEKAESLFAALSVLYPAESKHRLAYVCALLRQKRADTALALLDAMALTERASPAWHLLRAQSLAQLNRMAESRAAMARYLDVRSKDKVNS